MGANPYVLEPHWAVWMLVVEMFVAGVAAGTFVFIAIANLATDRTKGAVNEDQEVAARAGFVPLPLILLVGLLLIVDLGEPGRFLNQIFTHPSAAERPGPFFMNPNSPMNWGTYVILGFGLFTSFVFGDALLHTVWRRRLAIEGPLPFLRPLTEGLAHNPVYLAIGALFALATGAYSGVLLNVTNQNVWGDTVFMGGLYVAFSALSGMAVAAIVADRMGARRTASAVQSALFWFAAVCGVLMLLFVVNLAIVGQVTPLVADLDQLVAPIFWLGVVGLAIAYPLLALWRGGPVGVKRGGTTTLAVAGYDLGRLAIVGAGVLIGVLAFRYVLLYSALAALQ